MIPFEPVITILRLEEDRTYGTFGALLIQSKTFCVTLEPPYKANKSNVSCIPVGQYEALRIPSPKFGETYQLQNVPNRTLIEMHPGNTLSDTEGCIIIGRSWGVLRSNKRAVLNSGNTFKMFMKTLEPYKRIIVSIKPPGDGLVTVFTQPAISIYSIIINSYKSKPPA